MSPRMEAEHSAFLETRKPQRFVRVAVQLEIYANFSSGLRRSLGNRTTAGTRWQAMLPAESGGRRRTTARPGRQIGGMPDWRCRRRRDMMPRRQLIWDLRSSDAAHAEQAHDREYRNPFQAHDIFPLRNCKPIRSLDAPLEPDYRRFFRVVYARVSHRFQVVGNGSCPAPTH